MESDTPNLLLHLKQFSKCISSDLFTNLYLLDVVHPQRKALYILSCSVCVCVRVCVRACVRVRVCVSVSCMCMCARARARADPIMMVFVPGVEYGFLRVYNVT